MRGIICRDTSMVLLIHHAPQTFPPSPFGSRPTSFSSQCKAQQTLPTRDSIQPTFTQYASIQPTFLANLRPNPADLPPSYRPPRQVKPGYTHDKLNIGPQYVYTDPLSPHKTPTWPPSHPSRRQNEPQIDPTGANMRPTQAPNRPLRRQAASNMAPPYANP